MKKINNSVFRENITNLIKLMVKCEKKSPLFIAFYAVTAVLSPVLTSAMLKFMIDIVESGGGTGKIIEIILSVTVLSAVIMVVKCYFEEKRKLIGAKIRSRCMRMILAKSIRIPYVNMENREKRKKLEKAEAFVYSGDSGASYAARLFGDMAVSLTGIAAVSVLIFFLSVPLWAGLVLTGAGIFACISMLAEKEKKYNDELIINDKKLRYLSFGVPTETASAKDIRIYNISSWFSPLIDILIGDHKRLSGEFIKPLCVYSFIHGGLIIIRDVFALYFLVSSVLKGSLSAGDFAFYFGIINTFSLWTDKLARQTGDCKMLCMQFADFREFAEQKDESQEKEKIKPPVIDGGCEIEFKDVSFSYDGEKKAVDGVSFKAARGEKIAVVGENGAGKTTCMKLLSGLYSPDSGKITINGADLSLLTPSQRYSFFSALFQDAFKLAGTVGENVALTFDFDREKVLNALVKAGLGEKINSLEKGIDTNLDRELYSDSVEFSGGEMQKLFLARALYKDAPVIILDEPTAALDPIAENELYMRFNELTENKTAFYISHRLASTRFCDRIIFLKDGKIAETGTHEELMAKKGGYRRMYDIQSYYYNEEKNREALL